MLLQEITHGVRADSHKGSIGIEMITPLADLVGISSHPDVVLVKSFAVTAG